MARCGGILAPFRDTPLGGCGLEAAPLCALGASPFEGTLIARGGLGTVPYGALFVVVTLTAQDLALGASVVVPLSVVDEGIPAEQGAALLVVWQRDESADARPLYGRYVLRCAVCSVPGDRARPKTPTESAPEEHLLHGEILRDLSTGYQGVEDHARLATVHDVVREVAEPACAPLLLVHRRGIGVGGAHP